MNEPPCHLATAVLSLELEGRNGLLRDKFAEPKIPAAIETFRFRSPSPASLWLHFPNAPDLVHHFNLKDAQGKNAVTSKTWPRRHCAVMRELPLRKGAPFHKISQIRPHWNGH